MARTTLMRSGNTVIAYVGGKQFTYPCETVEEAQVLFKEANALKENEKELLAFLSPEYMTEEGVLRKDRRGNHYIGGVKTPLPALLVERIKERQEDEADLSPLINFWKLLMTNPNKDVREDLFRFADRFHFPITNNGYFIAYKSVLWKGQSFKAYAEFISSKFLYHISNGRKPANYTVVRFGEDEQSGFQCHTHEEWQKMLDAFVENWHENRAYDHVMEFIHSDFKRKEAFKEFQFNNRDEELSFNDYLSFAQSFGYEQPDEEAVLGFIVEEMKINQLGNLDELYAKLIEKFEVDEEGVFTDIHTMRMTIKLGQPVSMPMEECDTNRNNTCSSGLHVGAPGYVRDFGGHQSDRFVLACLVNPADVAAVPVDYGFEKMRTSRYYPYAVCEIDDQGQIVEIETKYFEDDYLDYEREIVAEKLRELNEIKNATKAENVNLDELEALLKDRLVVIGPDQGSVSLEA